MTTTQLILLICILAAIVAAAVVVAVVVKRRKASRSQTPLSAADQGAAALPTAAGAQADAGRVGAGQTAASSPRAGTAAGESGISATSSAVSETSATASAPRPETPESSASRLVRLRARLAGSGNPFGKALFSILSRDNLSEEDWEDVEDTLLLADVGAEASEQIVESLRADARVRGEKDPKALRQLLRERLLVAVGTDMDRTLAVDRAADRAADDAGIGAELSDTELSDAGSDAAATTAAAGGSRTPSVIIMVGVNGTGKTTTAGKLGRLLLANGKKVVMAAADTFRAAAADQLETWGKRVGIEVVRSDRDGADPASVAFDAATRAKEEKADALIIDTAGRLQNKQNLMDELGKIRRVVEKTLPVDEVLLVLDATTGQNGMSQARVFAQAIGITGVVLTKLDGSAKGGIVISVQRELGVPVKLVGLGEGPDDLAVFDPSSFVDGILG